MSSIRAERPEGQFVLEKETTHWMEWATIGHPRFLEGVNDAGFVN